MKIIFAIDPWIYRDLVGDQLYTLENIFIPSIKALSEYGHDVKLLIGEDLADVLLLKNISIPCKLHVISLKSLYNIYNNHYEAHKLQYKEKSTALQKEKLKKIIFQELDCWYPDVIISFTTPVSVWKELYQKSLSLQFENGIFSRSPYPYLCQLDPFGFLGKSYPYVFSKELKNTAITKKQKDRIFKLKKIYKEEIFDKYNPVNKKELIDYPGQKIVLVPLSYNGVVINDLASKYKSQLDFLLEVIYKTPKDVIILFTKHSLQITGGIPSETELYLLRKFPNLRYDKKFDHYAFCSQWLTPLVDGIITINSTKAYNGAFWDKKVFTLGNCEVNVVATSSNINSIDKYLNQNKKYNSKSYNVLYHLLTRYCFPIKYFFDPIWLTKRFEKMIDSKKAGTLDTSFTGMPLIDDEDCIFDLLVSESPAMKNNYTPRTRT